MIRPVGHKWLGAVLTLFLTLFLTIFLNSAAAVDKDTVGTVESARATFIAIDAAQIRAALAEPVDVAFAVSVGDPDVPIAAKALLVDSNKGGRKFPSRYIGRSGLGRMMRTCPSRSVLTT